MILSRKWLNEFVDVSDISDREFDEAMTLSGSKVETVTALDESLKKTWWWAKFCPWKSTQTATTCGSARAM